MTRAVYVVLAHDDQEQTNRLAAAILRSSPEARVLVAWDGRTRAAPGSLDPRTEVFVHGRRSDWGSWELVEATLDALRHARDRHDPDLTVLISASDYPVRRLCDWEDEAVAAASWVGDAAPLTYQPRWGRALGVGDDRLTRYSFRWRRALWSRWASRAPRWWWRVHAAVFLRVEPILGARMVTRGRGLHYGVRRIRSPFSLAHPCYFGSQWFAATRIVLNELLDDDFAPRSRLRQVYRHTVIPDESAIVTALAWRRPASDLPPVTHVRWDVAADQPVVWTLEDLPELRESGSPFCRKVDSVKSASLLDALDRCVV